MKQNRSCYSIDIETLPLLSEKNKVNVKLLKVFCLVQWIMLGVVGVLIILCGIVSWRRKCFQKIAWIFCQHLKAGSGFGLILIHFWLWSSTFLWLGFIAVIQPNFESFHHTTFGIDRAVVEDCFSSDSLNNFFKRYTDLIRQNYAPTEGLLNILFYCCLSSNICYLITGAILCMEHKYIDS